MSSAIDPTKPADGVPASKADLRANLHAAKDEIEALEAAQIPVGGTSGQVLAKNSNTDYDTGWVDQTGGGSVAVEDEGTQILASAARLNFVGAGVNVADAGSNKATVTIPSAGVAEVRETLHIPGGADGTYYVHLSSPKWRIDSLVAVTTETRACTAAVRIDGIAVSNLSSVSITTTKGTTNSTGANSVDAGDEVTVALSGGSGTGDVILTLIGALGAGGS